MTAVPGAVVGRRERKKAETRRALRTAAVRLVAERGLDAVTVEDITEAADVSLRTFSNYFAGKEEALTGPDPQWRADVCRELTARPAGESPLRALQAVLVADSARWARRREEWLAQLAVVKSDPRLLAAMAASWAVLERELAEAIAARSGLRPDRLAAEVVAAAGVAALRVAIRRWKTDTRESLSTLVRAGFDALAEAGQC